MRVCNKNIAMKLVNIILLSLLLYLLYVWLSVGGEGSRETPLILVWNGYQEDDQLWRIVFQRITSGQCQARCRVTRDKARLNESSAIVFHLPNLHWEGYNFPAYRDPSVPWILMSYESANSIRERAGNWGRFPPLSRRDLTSQFNRTLSLRRDSDLVARHGEVTRRETPLTTEELGRLYSPDTAGQFAGYNLTQEDFLSGVRGPAPVVWFVSHCHDYNGRMKYVRLLQKYIGVDIYGDCGDLSCGSSRNMGARYKTERDPCFDLVNRKYKFYLSFENALCADYITEKAFNALRLNTVPVMLGGADYNNTLPPHSFIDALQFPHPAQLADHLYSLLHQPAKFSSYFSWRPHYDVTSHVSVPDNCQLCEKLAAGELAEHHVINNMWDWIIRDSHCVFTKRKWNTDKFLQIWKSQRNKKLEGATAA